MFTPDANENAAFALCGYARRPGEERLYVRRLVEVPTEGYTARTPVHLEVKPRFINEVVSLANGRMAILVIHSHPRGLMSGYSASDDYGEERLLGVLSDLIPAAPHSSLLFSESGLIGRFLEAGKFVPIEETRVVGATLSSAAGPRRFGRKSRKTKSIDSSGREFDRQVLAFGQETQRRIEATRVAVVGCGGTGSCVSEQLARLGVRDFLLVDPDRFEASNLTRVYGSNETDIPSAPLKTDIVERNLRGINSALLVSKESSSIISRKTIAKLVGRDIIFSCTDNGSSRALLNRFAYQYFVPMIDVGTRIVAAEGRITGAAGRVSMVGPSLPCLWCAYHLDAAGIRAETMGSQEREKLTREGYIQGVDETAPAVISLNSTVASLSVTMLLGTLTPFGRVPQDSPEQIYDALDGTVFRVSPVANPSCHVCGSKGVLGLGDLEEVTTFP
ncbi:MAG TPA: ThiF family adenylyltransferase [Thermoplasmata archaeon]|nr:ThiF family adenylyltransferase [Thermoplasmata archaeon]